MSDSNENTLFVIDVMPLLYRGHFVFLRNPRITATGINTSALLGFAGTMTKILEAFDPAYLALVLDSTTPTFRHERYPPYKAQRQKIPEDLRAAIPMAIELAEALKIRILREDGFEADDLMGALASAANREGLDCVLVTPDKDVAQLVTEKTRLYRPSTSSKPGEMLGPDEVRRQWSLSDPGRMVDLLGLCGDASDNIPGIRGVGEKTAVALLKKYGTLDAVLANAGEIKGKMGERIREQADTARLSRDLARIRRDTPLALSIRDLRRGEPDREPLRAVVEKYELRQLGKRFLGEDLPDAPAPPGALKTLADIPHDYRLADDAPTLDALLERLAKADAWAFDTETTGLNPWEADIVGMSFCIEPGQAWYLPLPAEREEARRRLARVKPLLENPRIAKIGQNLKYDASVLRRAGIVMAGAFHDTMLAQYVLDSTERHGMTPLARRLLGYQPIEIEELIGKKGAASLTMADLAPETIRDYACEDADVTLRLHTILRPEVARAEALPALEKCEEPLIPVLVDMEAAGVKIDPEILAACSRDLTRELLEIEKRIFDLAGGGFNIASPKQLGAVLFDRLGLDEKAARTRTGQYATGEDVLRRLRGAHPVIDLILDFRACSKLKNTYVDKLPRCIRPATGRIHTTFSQALTETGRLSSLDPNLQNIPIRTDRGRRVRAAFVAGRPDYRLLSADYSQIELRIMAAFSRDEAMIAAFRRQADIHRETAARVFNVAPEAVTPAMRAKAKMVNFGIIYGISAFGLSRRLGVPRAEADALITAYFEKYPGVRNYMDETIAYAREHGFVRTLLGRRRSLRDINSRNKTSRRGAERNAINTPIQGSAADLIKMAMVDIHRKIREQNLRSKMVLQIHDELLFDVPEDEIGIMTELTEASMTRTLPLENVPLKVEIGHGRNWLEAH